MTKLGDSHNFGQSVQICGEWVKKPRPLFWEWLFLSQQSPVRKKIQSLAGFEGNSNPFEYFPNLDFEFEDNPLLNSSGKVEFCDTEAPEELNQNELTQAFGKCLGVAFFWGISDLHFENIVYSKDFSRTLLFPIDIETIFFRKILLSQTSMLRSLKNNFKSIGAKHLIELTPNIAQIINMFRQTIDFFNCHREEIYKELLKLELGKYPIRCILKPTYVYYTFLKNGGKSDVFFEEEIEQLERGDIPYFYTFLGGEQIWYLTPEGPKVLEQKWGDAFKRDEMPKPSIETLQLPVEPEKILHSTLQIARTFDPEIESTYQSGETSVVYSADNIFLTTNKGVKVRCKRLKA